MSTFGGGGVPCTICEKTVFPAEMVSFEKKPYHIECFRCQETKPEDSTCGKKLEASNAMGYADKLYCKQCFAAGGYAQKQRNVKWTPKTNSTSNSLASKFGGGGNPCVICSKTVYPAETVSYEKKVYHIECFKCTTCTKKITPSGAASYEDQLYCKKCFADGGFTQKQRNVKWVPKESSSSGVASKFGGGGTKCEICAKTVYPAEMVSYEKKAYHQECFKCNTCTKKMSPADASKFTDDEGKETIFCRKCFGEGGWNKKQAAVKKTDAAPKTYDNRFAKFGGGGDKCVICAKTVYPAEKLSFEKNVFHIGCFKCSFEGCSKGGKPITVNDAQYQKHDDGTITVFCTKCFGEQGLNRA